MPLYYIGAGVLRNKTVELTEEDAAPGVTAGWAALAEGHGPYWDPYKDDATGEPTPMASYDRTEDPTLKEFEDKMYPPPGEETDGGGEPEPGEGAPITATAEGLVLTVAGGPADQAYSIAFTVEAAAGTVPPPDALAATPLTADIAEGDTAEAAAGKVAAAAAPVAASVTATASGATVTFAEAAPGATPTLSGVTVTPAGVRSSRGGKRGGRGPQRNQRPGRAQPKGGDRDEPKGRDRNEPELPGRRSRSDDQSPRDR